MVETSYEPPFFLVFERRASAALRVAPRTKAGARNVKTVMKVEKTHEKPAFSPRLSSLDMVFLQKTFFPAKLVLPFSRTRKKVSRKRFLPHSVKKTAKEENASFFAQN